MRWVATFGLVPILVSLGCGALDFANYAIDSYHEVEAGVDNRYGDGTHDLMLEGRLKCTMCDGTGVCSHCDGSGCALCDGTGVCPHCQGKGYTQEIDVPGAVGEIDDVLDKL